MLVGQVALTLMLLAGAALFVRSLRNLNNLDLGFDTPHLLRARLVAGATGPGDADRFFREALRRASALPGTQRAALATGGPFAAYGNRALAIPGLARIEPSDWPRVNGVTADYFETLGMPLIRGRNFTSADEDGDVHVAIVNDVMARRWWPSGDALGKCLQVGGDTNALQYNHRHRACGAARQRRGQAGRERAGVGRVLSVRSTAAAGRTHGCGCGRPGTARSSFPQFVASWRLLPPIHRIPTWSQSADRLAEEFRPWRFGATMCGISGGAAFLLALVGLYGVLAFRVSQRTHEIGVRMALGAQRRDVRRLVVGHGFGLAAIGVAIGLSASLAFARLLNPLLYKVSASDPLTLALTGCGLLTVACVASLVPATRATRIDPMEALREL